MPDLEKAIKARLTKTRNRLEGFVDVEKPETDDEKKRRIGNPAYCVERLFQEVKVADETFKKLQEMDGDKSDVFWDLDDKFFNEELGLKDFIARKRLTKRMGEIKADHEKEQGEKDIFTLDRLALKRDKSVMS